MQLSSPPRSQNYVLLLSYWRIHSLAEYEDLIGPQLGHSDVIGHGVTYDDVVYIKFNAQHKQYQ